eukprot:COSAG01_NODE_2565_length_7448_cov_405.607566_4_plen_269_part_00
MGIAGKLARVSLSTGPVQWTVGPVLFHNTNDFTQTCSSQAFCSQPNSRSMALSQQRSQPAPWQYGRCEGRTGRCEGQFVAALARLSGSTMVFPGGQSQEPLLYAIQHASMHEEGAEARLSEQCRQIVASRPTSVHATDATGYGALHYAAKRGLTQLTEQLAEEHRLDVEVQGEGGQQPVHWAAAWGPVSVLATLLRHGASLESADANGCNPLHYAAMHGQHVMVQYLLGRGCAANAVDREGFAALHRAACCQHRLVVRSLLLEGGGNR